MTAGLRSADQPVVAVAGRPNVGKSTLVNRILGRREAIVQEQPGVTRDCKAVQAVWLGRRFTLLDTGGWTAGGDALAAAVSARTERAVRSADAVLFVADARVGPTADDEAVARMVRSADVPVLLAANKVDHARHAASAWELLGLGLGDPYPVSALHGSGTGDLLDALIRGLDHPASDTPEPEAARGGADASGAPGSAVFSVVLVGRPNVGKSTLFNRLADEDLSIAHDQPGTTRDTIDTLVSTEAGLVRFVDTAGLRRRARVDSDIEYYSVVRALRAVEAVDVALLVVDASAGVTRQDQRLAERVDAAGCPLAVLLNKWDLVGAEARSRAADGVGRRLGFLGRPPVLRISALSGRGVGRLWPVLQAAIREYRTRIPTRHVNEAVRSAQSAQPAPGGARILYAVQGAAEPPTFTLFVNRALPRTYLRYVERSLREAFGWEATAVKVRVRVRNRAE